MQHGFGTAAMRHQIPDAFGVCSQVVVKVTTFDHRQVDHVVHIARAGLQTAVISKVSFDSVDAHCLELLTLLLVRKTRHRGQLTLLSKKDSTTGNINRGKGHSCLIIHL